MRYALVVQAALSTQQVSILHVPPGHRMFSASGFRMCVLTGHTDSTVAEAYEHAWAASFFVVDASLQALEPSWLLVNNWASIPEAEAQ